MLSEREMFERSFSRPKNFYQLDPEVQWNIDKSLGILDWEGTGLSPEDLRRLRDHYDIPNN